MTLFFAVLITAGTSDRTRPYKKTCNQGALPPPPRAGACPRTPTGRVHGPRSPRCLCLEGPFSSNLAPGAS